MSLHNFIDPADWSVFNGRLNYLMQNSKCKSAPKLAVALYEEGLVVVNARKGSYEFDDGTEERKNAIGSIKKIIEKHLKESDPRRVKGEYIIAYCNYFGCSADWLLGFSKIKSNDEDVRKICENIGLSETAATALVRITGKGRNSFKMGMESEKYLTVMNKLLSTPLFSEFINVMECLDEKYKEYYKIPYAITKDEQDLTNEAINYYKENPNYDEEELAKERPELVKHIGFAEFLVQKYLMSNNRELILARYDLREVFEDMISEIYPDIERMVRINKFSL